MRVVPLSAAVLLLLESTCCLASVTDVKSSYLRKGIEASNAVETKEQQNMAEDSSYWKRLMQETTNMSSDVAPFGPGNKGDAGDTCFENADCDTDVCVEDPPVADGSGRCACNAETQQVCDNGFFCATSEEIFLAVGELISVATVCTLPVGAPCQDSFECLTNICDPVTGTCGCNPFTNFPCSDGEACLVDSVEGQVCKVPDDEVGDGGNVGDLCFENADCDTDVCVEDPPVEDGSGRCACNADTQQGCDDGFFCATPEEIGLAVGELVSVATVCTLPVGAPCQDSLDCLTGFCDELTNTCGCNPYTNFPCSDGEACLVDSVEGHVCKDPQGEVGDGSLGSECLVDGDCLTDECYYGFQPPGTLGTCTCNPLTGAGCTGNFECFSSEDFQEIAGIFDLFPECSLPFGAPCDDISGSCVTGNCAELTSQCTCNELTNFPCNTDNGETCVIDGEGSLACLVVEGDCPDPDPDIACTTEFKEVLCPGDCKYSNQCVATSADASFTDETCTLVNNCPVGTGICTQEFAPVNCFGCEYSNQCKATDANPEFTAETCTPVTPNP